MLIGMMLLLSLILSIWLMGDKDATKAEIRSEGKLLYTLDLSVNQEITIETAEGSNTVTIKNGAIAVTAANCPDKICMQRGYCSTGTPIVCLPNGLIIQFAGQQEVDADAG